MSAVTFMTALLLLAMGVGCNAECNSEIPGSCPTDTADVSDLLQTRVQVSDLEMQESGMDTDARRAKLFAERTYYTSFVDMSQTRYAGSVPIFNAHDMPGGLNPSELQLAEAHTILADFLDVAAMDSFCADLAASDNTCSCDSEEYGVDIAEITCPEIVLAAFVESEEEAGKDVPIFMEPNVEQHAFPVLDAHEVNYTALIEKAQEKGSVTWGIDRIDGVSGTDGKYAAYPGSKEGAGVHVYVADTGITTSHVDFEGRAIPAAEFLGGKGASGKKICTDTSCAGDTHGHGTHCAGTIGSKTYGAAKKTNLYALKVLNPGGYMNDIIASVDWVVTSGKKPAIWSASLGGPGKRTSYEQAFKKAVAKNVIISVAAGNSNSDACKFSPAFAPTAITAGSTTSADKRSHFSNYGKCIDIWAPGSSITSTKNANSGTKTMSGTSMACPHVSGVMAMLLSDMAPPDYPTAEALMKSIGISGQISDIKPKSPDLMLYTGGATNPVVPGATFTTTTLMTSTTTTPLAGAEYICARMGGKCSCPYGEVRYGFSPSKLTAWKSAGSAQVNCVSSVFGNPGSPSSYTFCYCKLPGALSQAYQGSGVSSLSGYVRCPTKKGGCTATVSFPRPWTWTGYKIYITELKGDFASSSEYATVQVNGKYLSPTVKCSSGNDCQTGKGSKATCLTGKHVTSYISSSDKTITVGLKGTGAVNYCTPEYIWAKVTLIGTGFSGVTSTTTTMMPPTTTVTTKMAPPPPPPGTDDCNGTKTKAALAAEKLTEVVKAVNATIDTLKEFEKLP
mmetsp:Transcript_159536/g.294075  ORF Transcript_159536/g.294075 Transcript_159536/m.294075 type:complete len:789 (+) Transcript_159536:85-2451(+)